VGLFHQCSQILYSGCFCREIILTQAVRGWRTSRSAELITYVCGYMVSKRDKTVSHKGICFARIFRRTAVCGIVFDVDHVLPLCLSTLTYSFMCLCLSIFFQITHILCSLFTCFQSLDVPPIPFCGMFTPTNLRVCLACLTLIPPGGHRAFVEGWRSGSCINRCWSC
jgi:hypothetical protein